MGTVTAYPKADIDKFLGTKITRPSGGQDGQVLIKSGTGVAWASADAIANLVETIQDTVAAMLVGSGISFDYDDATGKIVATVTATGSGGTSGGTTTPTLTNTAAPAITGGNTVGSVLTASNGSWSAAPDQFDWQWKRAGTAITNATSATYTITSADTGQALTVTVTARKTGYNPGGATSTAFSIPASTTAATFPATGLQQRFRAASLSGVANGAAVGTVPFENGNLTLASTGSARPTYIAAGVKNLPALRFDGVDDKLTLSSGGLALAQPFTVLVVLDIKNATAGQEVLNLGNVELLLNASGQTGWQSYNGALVSKGTVTTGIHSFMISAPGDGSVTLMVDGTTIGGGYAGAGNIPATTFSVGVSPDSSRYLNADLYEIATYNRHQADPNNAGDLTTLNNYLASTYGIGSVSTPAGAGSAMTYSATFGSRPTSAAMDINGQVGGTISNKQFTGIGNDVSAIHLTNCRDVVIEQCDFTDCCQPITLTGCTNITIRWNRAKNITGPYQRNGSNRGNFTQWVQCTRGYIGYNSIRDGNTEDVISIYQSNGTSAEPIVVEYNRIENETYTSSSGSGIMLGDGGGTWQVARFNQMLNPGQVGVAAAGGRNIKILSNTIWGDAKPTSNIGIYVCDYSLTQGGMGDITVQDNRVYYKKSDGTVNGFYTDGTAGTVTGQSQNQFADSTVDRSSLVVSL